MVKIKKIVVVSWKNFDQSVLTKNYINSLKKKFKIYLFDISALSHVYNSHVNKFSFDKKIITFNNIESARIKNFTNLKNKINKIKPDLIIVYIIENYSARIKILFNRIKSLNIPLVKICDTFFIEKYKYYYQRIKQLIFRKKIYYDYIFYAGSRNINNFYISKNNVYAHHYDYEKFINENNKTKKLKNSKKYAVFLDENVVYHPDVSFNNHKNWISSDEYYKSIVNFFDSFSKNFSIDIKIAAHPSTIKKSFFGKYKLYFDNIVQLVRNAELVLLHQSTSLSFPILFKKKILFLTSNCINKTTLKKNIFSLSKFFNKKPINIDDKFDKSIIKKTTISYSIKYKEYKDSFLKHPKSLNKNFLYIFKNYFDERK